MIRVLDIFFSVLLLLILMPVIMIIALIIKIDSRGPLIFVQKRVGKGNVDFDLYKFRTMYIQSNKGSLITIGKKDQRITRAGLFLRRYKLDEIPQLWNVLKGDMSLVGPRPEVRKYVDLYTEEQKKVLDVKPGITDYASIKYKNENELLEGKDDPEDFYILHIMPDKIRLNMKYINKKTTGKYLKIIFVTFASVFLGEKNDFE
jgi:lipopolysaccharide/colanic/teichoic acid biosynthesis glycosyltransferase